MRSTYIERIQKLSEKLSDPALAERARKINSNTFSRNRKMPLKDILLCCLSKKGLTTTLELRNYFIQKDVPSMKMSKQGYLQQRKRLNPEVFSYLNDEYMADFYHSSEPRLWNGFLLLAIDGSKAEVPNSPENRERFGKSNNQHSELGQVRVLVSGMYDILNHFYLDIEISHISTSETEIAKKNLHHLTHIDIKQPVLAIFDRGYPSMEFIDFLETEKINYLFRISSNDYKFERRNMKSTDETVILRHTYQRLEKIRKKHPERLERMKEKGYTNTRIMTSMLPSGNELALMTNLPFEFSQKQLEDLYYQRWEIEKKYHTLKNKMKFESVTGKSTIYVDQDFRAQVLVYNILQDIRKEADEEVSVRGRKKGSKHPMHTNENIAIGLFKEQMIKLILEKNAVRRGQLLFKLQTEMEEYILPQRNLPGKERKKNLSNKYKNNQKNSFKKSPYNSIGESIDFFKRNTILISEKVTNIGIISS